MGGSEWEKGGSAECPGKSRAHQSPVLVKSLPVWVGLVHVAHPQNRSEQRQAPSRFIHGDGCGDSERIERST